MKLNVRDKLEALLPSLSLQEPARSYIGVCPKPRVGASVTYTWGRERSILCVWKCV